MPSEGDVERWRFDSALLSLQDSTTWDHLLWLHSRPRLNETRAIEALFEMLIYLGLQSYCGRSCGC